MSGDPIYVHPEYSLHLCGDSLTCIQQLLNNKDLKNKTCYLNKWTNLLILIGPSL